MKSYKWVDEILISNGDKKNAVEFSEPNVKTFDDSALNTIYSLDLRFLCGLRAKNENLLFLDDDMLISENQLEKVILEYKKNSNRIVGCYGRSIEKGYTTKNVYGDCDIVLTKLMLCKKNLCSLFFICKPLIEETYKKGIPYGNGEDIFFSFLAGIYYNTKHFSVNSVIIQELSQTYAISHHPNHLPYRKELCSILKEKSELFHSFIKQFSI
jgi:hypothetical protein